MNTISPLDPKIRSSWGHGYASGVGAVTGTFMLAAGVYALAAPQSFAEFANFPDNVHFVHDAGAFQLGIGITLLLALAWSDGLAVALAGSWWATPSTPSTTRSIWTSAAMPGTPGVWPCYRWPPLWG